EQSLQGRESWGVSLLAKARVAPLTARHSTDCVIRLFPNWRMRVLGRRLDKAWPVMRAPRGNQTGNEQETKRRFLCKIGNVQETRNGNEAPFFDPVRFLRSCARNHRGTL